MGPISKFTLKSVKRGWDLVRGNNIRRIDNKINKLNKRIEFNDSELGYIDRLIEDKRLTPDKQRRAKALIDRQERYEAQQGRLAKRRNFEQNKSNMARLTLLGAATYGTGTGLSNAYDNRTLVPEYAGGGQFEKVSGNIPADTSKPSSSDPVESPDYFDYQEYVNSKTSTPDRSNLPVFNDKEGNNPIKIARALGADLFVINTIEEELGLRDRMPAEKLASIKSTEIQAKRAGSTLLGLAILDAAIANANKNVVEWGMEDHDVDLRPNYAL